MAPTPPQPDRDAAAAAMASIPPYVVNLLGDARVVRLAVGRGGAWIGSFVRTLDPPMRIEEAVLAASSCLGGLRNVSLGLTNGLRVWFGPDFRFRTVHRASVATSVSKLGRTP